ncbi:hypothetical protein ACQYAD_18330 [Neobacillus sp. SM06]|uniref:hypothetical protein n=1 Tax=Neobacillus sp. SM06 TaxID=3422492 RepID=UPI003D269360
MFVVSYFENKNLLLTQLSKRIPSEGDELKIKGRKGKVTNVSCIDEKNIHIQITLETVPKNKLIVDPSKKKKGK